MHMNTGGSDFHSLIQITERLLAIIGAIASIIGLFLVVWGPKVLFVLRNRISWREVSRLIDRVIDHLSQIGGEYDVVVGVRRSGCICGAIIAGNLGGLPVYCINTELEWKSGGASAQAAEMTGSIPDGVAEEWIKEKSVLVVSCFNITGVSPKVTLDYLKTMNPKRVTFVTLYESRYTLMHAAFAAKRVDEAVAEKVLSAMPWMKRKSYRHPHVTP